MKLVRVGPAGKEKPALVDAARGIRDLSAHLADIDLRVLDGKALDALRRIEPEALPQVAQGTRIGPCVAHVGKLVCVGLNHSDHAAESNMPVPTEPILFLEPSSAVCGPGDDVELPRGSKKTDWEVEPGVVIGRRAKYVSEDDALDHVAGYCIVNDVSEREFQLERQGQWDKGKGHDTFAPIGPWLVTRDEVSDPQRLGMWLDVNGLRCQRGSTRTMVFGAAMLVSYISRFMTLEPGDIISTGTPPGVGMGRTPPVFLKPGDVMTLGIDGLGEQRLRCVAA
ncbi:MAG: fumarylacetoacetate hydrolase family protein [Acidobacteria bacterium]|nr:fumarylacetoacetate hydrolase family protein [Acidobacteriota bacterium]